MVKGKTGLVASLKTILRVLRKKAPLRMVYSLDSRKPIRSEDLPAGYQLQRYVPGDEEGWLELLNESKEFGRWDKKRLHKALLSTLLPGGGVLLAHEGKWIGCTAVCALEGPGGRPHLMYVTVLPAYRGLGLGRWLVQESLAISQQQTFSEIVLETTNRRLAAISLYLRLGFQPLLEPGAAGRRQWSDVLARIFLPH